MMAIYWYLARPVEGPGGVADWCRRAECTSRAGCRRAAAVKS